MDKKISSKTAQKLMVTFEVKKGDNIYSFAMPYNCPLQEAYDSTREVMLDLIQMADNAAEQAKKQKEEAESVEKKPEDSK